MSISPPSARLLVAVAFVILTSGCSAAAVSESHSSSDADRPASTSPSAEPIAPLRVVGRTPHAKLDPQGQIVVDFSAPVADSSAMPTISPATNGMWQMDGTTATFTPAQAYAPDTAFTVTVPGGESGTKGTDGSVLGSRVRFTVHSPTAGVGFAEQILARLHYLPLTTTARPADAQAEAAAVYDPPASDFGWRWSTTPHALKALWKPNEPNTLLKGALLAFQHDSGLTPDELLGAQTWKKLLAADLAGTKAPRTYSYVYADLSIRPQTLTVWKGGATILTTPTNGGVPGAPTPDGTFPIYERLTSTTMSGTNPDGSHYRDPGVPWVSYFIGGSAVHGFPRASYGSPQSVGCLELPISTAQRVFGLVDYGTLVTVAGR